MTLHEIAKSLRGRYPSTLFHFTDKLGLLGILTSNFKVSYAREHVRGTREEREFALPMVSFCDLRLSELREHMLLYQRYGIGMSKEWANRNGLNTVYYINRSAALTDTLIKSIDGLFREIRSCNDYELEKRLIASYTGVLGILQFVKNYEGPNRKLSLKNYRFADEREWRYVPSAELGPPFVPLERVDSPAKKIALNQRFDRQPLYFEPNDIRYIIVDREDERDEIIDKVFHAKESKYGGDARRLASRILTAEQIDNDV